LKGQVSKSQSVRFPETPPLADLKKPSGLLGEHTRDALGSSSLEFVFISFAGQRTTPITTRLPGKSWELPTDRRPKLEQCHFHVTDRIRRIKLKRENVFSFPTFCGIYEPIEPHFLQYPPPKRNYPFNGTGDPLINSNER
jgi:hypothetical protein